MATEKKKDFDVVADILRAATLGSKESEIMVGCNLDRESLEKYVPAMMVLKLVNLEKLNENYYRTTTKGIEFLRFYHGLRWLVWGEDFDYTLIKTLCKITSEESPCYVT
ncbi:MAG: winged helix-turn-helix domain-containing protein [Candidatus Bathyarchaeia archaeon]